MLNYNLVSSHNNTWNQLPDDCKNALTLAHQQGVLSSESLQFYKYGEVGNRNYDYSPTEVQYSSGQSAMYYNAFEGSMY